jgi:hypothetical protein
MSIEIKRASVSDSAGSARPDKQLITEGPSSAADEEKGPSSEASSQSNPPVPAPQTYTKPQWILVLIAIYGSEFLYGLDTTIVADIQGSIISDLGGVTQLGWLSVGFPLGSVATMLMLCVLHELFCSTFIPWIGR